MEGVERGKPTVRERSRNSGQWSPKVGVSPGKGYEDSPGEILKIKQNKAHIYFHPPEIVSVRTRQRWNYLAADEAYTSGSFPCTPHPSTRRGAPAFLIDNFIHIFKRVLHME